MKARICWLGFTLAGLAACGPAEVERSTDARGKIMHQSVVDARGNSFENQLVGAQARQTSVGGPNAFAAKAVNSRVEQTSVGAGNSSLAQVVNTNVQQTNVGFGNSQTVIASNAGNVQQNQVGIGNRQTLVLGISAGPKASAPNIQMNQSGYFNSHTLRIGEAKKREGQAAEVKASGIEGTQRGGFSETQMKVGNPLPETEQTSTSLAGAQK